MNSNSLRHRHSLFPSHTTRLFAGRISRPPALVVLLWLMLSEELQAGMPSPQLILTELGKRRMEELSFFFVLFLLTAAVVRWLWNYVQVEIPTLPRLTFRRTVAILLLWGMAMTVVLSVISGARELMTPAAWEPNGITHQLKKQTTVEQPQDQRRAKLERLRTLLWQHAATHDGQFPDKSESESSADEAWMAQPQGRLKFIYIAGLSAKSEETILVYEPEIYDDGQYVLMTSGRIARLSDISVMPIQK